MDNLKGIPTIYYSNLHRRKGRKLYMESQFKKYNLPYYRIGLPTLPCEISQEFLDRLIGTYSESSCLWASWCGSFIIEFLYEWFTETKEQTLIYMEDDYDLSLIERWHFTWDQLIDYLPYDWDIILLGFESPDIIPFHLHPTRSEYSLGPLMFNRNHVEKILDLHYFDGKFKFDNTIANSIYIDRDSGIDDGKTYVDTSGTMDYFFTQTGCSYSIPLLQNNPYFAGGSSGENHDGNGKWFPKITFVQCYEAYKDWWTYDRDLFSLDEFFTYGKDTDILMQRDITRWDHKYFYDLSLREREKYLNLESMNKSRKQFLKDNVE